MVVEPIRDRRAERREATKAEILDAAWEIVRKVGLGALTLRDIAQRVGMRSPSLYVYFDSKHAVYDAMFAQGYAQFGEVMTSIPERGDLRVVLRDVARRFLRFCSEDAARFQLLFQRTIPGFEPSPEAYAVSVELMEHTVDRFAGFGITDPKAIDLWTAVMSGLASQQLANDPGGRRWTRLVDETVDMYCEHLMRTGRIQRRAT
jgi:AcrR family transcriptional regulator